MHTFNRSFLSIIVLAYSIEWTWTALSKRWNGWNLPVESAKKWNTFSAWWWGMGFHHCSQSFYLPAPTGPNSNFAKLYLGVPYCRELVPPPWSCILFILWPHSTLWLIHNGAVLHGKTKSFQNEYVCHNHRIVVKQYVWQCWVFDDNACMWRNNCHTFWCFLLISFQKLYNLKQIISKKIYGHWLEYFFFLIFKYAH